MNFFGQKGVIFLFRYEKIDKMQVAMWNFHRL